MTQRSPKWITFKPSKGGLYPFEGFFIKVIDINNPSNPEIVGSINSLDHSFGLEIVDNIAFVAGGNSGLQLVDISDPSKVKIISSVDTPINGYGGADDVAVSGDKI